MANTALRAKTEQIAETVTFRNDKHKQFFLEYLPKCRYVDVYHAALIYCLGMDEHTRSNIHNIYDLKIGCVKIECLHEPWITSGSAKIIRMAYNLYTDGTPSVEDYKVSKKKLEECRQYTVGELFCCDYANYFWQAIKIRYPQYCC